jgi:hypothetical protein
MSTTESFMFCALLTAWRVGRIKRQIIVQARGRTSRAGWSCARSCGYTMFGAEAIVSHLHKPT